MKKFIDFTEITPNDGFDVSLMVFIHTRDGMVVYTEFSTQMDILEKYIIECGISCTKDKSFRRLKYEDLISVAQSDTSTNEDLYGAVLDYICSRPATHWFYIESQGESINIIVEVNKDDESLTSVIYYPQETFYGINRSVHQHLPDSIKYQ